MMTRRSFALTLAASSAAFCAPAAKEQGRDLAGKTVKALGGDAFRNMRTRTEIGHAYSFYHSKLTSLSVARLYTQYLLPNSAGPLHQLQCEVLGKKQEDTVIFTPTEAYDVTYRGAQPLEQQRVEQYRNTTMQDFFYILRMRFDEPGLEFEANGADVVENQPVNTLEIYDSQDRNVTVWINSDNFLPVKQRYRRWDPTIKERREEVTSFSKYRDAGNGVMWPHAIERERDSEKISQFYSDRVTVNNPLNGGMFELPKGVKMLTGDMLADGPGPRH